MKTGANIAIIGAAGVGLFFYLQSRSKPQYAQKKSQLTANDIDWPKTPIKSTGKSLESPLESSTDWVWVKQQRDSSMDSTDTECLPPTSPVDTDTISAE